MSIVYNVVSFIYTETDIIVRMLANISIKQVFTAFFFGLYMD